MRSHLPAAHKIIRPALLGVGALLALGLLRFAFAGLSTRYWADDFCYSAVFAAGGLLRGPLDWFMASGNRFSTIYLVGLQDFFGPGAIRLAPTLLLLALLGGWLVFLRGAARAADLKPDPFALAALVSVQVFFLILLAPDRLQALYWRMGGLHYTFPLALLLLNLGFCLPALRGRSSAWLLAGSGALAFFAGGFSETFAALQAGAFGLAALAAAALLSRPDWRRAFVFLPGLAGGLAAMGLMLLSPSNAWRQAALPPPDSLVQLVGYTLRYTFDFAADTLRGAPLPLLALVLLSGGAAAVIAPANAQPRANLLPALGCLLAGLTLSACAIAPSVYAGLQFPAGRALMPARFALLMGLAAAAACLARAIYRPGARLADGLLLLALLGGGLYAGRHLSQLLPEQAVMPAWAERWDKRDAQIRAAAAAGELDLLVPQVEVVRGLEDIGPDPAHWVNRCTAAYYRVNSIRVVP
jgi:hypothetical protein